MEIDAAREVRTTCPYCGVGCGVLAKVAADGQVSVRGDPDHPANFGRLCSKGSALAETIGLDGRLLHPEIHGRRTGWNEALDIVASTFSQTIAEHGSDAVAFYVSGQLLTEDYYLANKLMKGFVGSANIDTNSRLCMASSVAGHRRAFGSDTVPGTYEDLERADLIVLVGSNLAWCHPVLYQRIAAAREKRPEMKIVLVDPRRTMTSDIADMHLAIAPDGDVALFTGLLAWLGQHNALDRAYITAHTSGFGQALFAASALDLTSVATATGLSEDELVRFYSLFAATAKTVTIYSQGVNQSSSGTDKVNAIINCHLATGRIGKPGTGPFSVTGQPNAMGGREVGGMANLLAAHMEIENPEHRDRVRRFWNAPDIAQKPGLKAVEMFQGVADGRIKALWIMATNPVDSMPDADAVEAAIKACPFVVISDVLASTDTVRHAHVRLPAAAWGEKDGSVTNSERRISRQRSFLAAPGEVRPDWWIIAEVARRMGFAEAFAHETPAQIFGEHAALSGFENDGERDFDIGAYAKIDAEGYERLAPFQWPVPSPGGGTTEHLPTRFFANGHFYTADRKARFIAIRATTETRTTADFPLILNTGRIRDHWHTMTRTGKSPRLSQHIAEPFVEIHPVDAQHHGIGDADIVRVSSPRGDVLVRALITPRQRQGCVFAPMHWTDQFAAKGRLDALTAPLIDPVSGQPALKHVAARIEKFAAKAFGFAVMRRRPEAIAADYWAVARCKGGWRVELAFADDDADWTAFAGSLFEAPSAEMLAYHDRDAGQHRIAAFDGERLIGALFVAPGPVAVSRGWATEQLEEAHASQRGRFRIVAGRAGAERPDAGATVCSCFSVGANQIVAAVAAGCITVEAIGGALKAGTNCGSCRSEIRALIQASRVQAAE
ncbi:MULTISPECIES: nitrate reductase [Mesorhizobium]|uniref:Nitrate reductase n=2 Tax=Mesorhizobium TaxID=68287 RepID=A0A1A5JX17_RHILI|nr:MULTISPECIES: nitrate reductase [Mesorhizobium]MBE1706514.1 molybdopterin-dependent oxidoreductase [Mesorhizobium japonicum]MBE1714975.1 molybdopterin-dependent oxidoreductase [Mesorhizobium japonicum]MUT21562.1 molybdopterin-dependent oxidoreductase [Mesorhizobium japonicum]MUT27413.1 molybdopterin-dependent oxidoreductase [Mesorhizobium japonicum]OBP74066.1 nitrate reductase [Mesorhizobium loti]